MKRTVPTEQCLQDVVAGFANFFRVITTPTDPALRRPFLLATIQRNDLLKNFHGFRLVPRDAKVHSFSLSQLETRYTHDGIAYPLCHSFLSDSPFNVGGTS